MNKETSIEELNKKIEEIDAAKPKSRTELIFDKKVEAQKNPTILDTVWDLLDLEKTMETKYDGKIETIKINYFKFFIFGVLFAYASIFFSLRGIGIILDWKEYAWIILSFFVSIGFAFIWGKFKEAVPLILSDPEKMKNMLYKLVDKLS